MINISFQASRYSMVIYSLYGHLTKIDRYYSSFPSAPPACVFVKRYGIEAVRVSRSEHLMRSLAISSHSQEDDIQYHSTHASSRSQTFQKRTKMQNVLFKIHRDQIALCKQHNLSYRYLYNLALSISKSRSPSDVLQCYYTMISQGERRKVHEQGWQITNMFALMAFCTQLAGSQTGRQTKTRNNCALP